VRARKIFYNSCFAFLLPSFFLLIVAVLLGAVCDELSVHSTAVRPCRYLENGYPGIFYILRQTSLHRSLDEISESNMAAKSTQGPGGKQPASAATNLIAGGGAGMMEALVCHPLDTIKVRMQLSRRARAPGAKRIGFIGTGVNIVKRETPLGLYKGLGAVLTGIVPKMAIRFTSYEWYKQLLADKDGKVSGRATFLGAYWAYL
jgi:hypothetical protein